MLTIMMVIIMTIIIKCLMTNISEAHLKSKGDENLIFDDIEENFLLEVRLGLQFAIF